MTWCHRPAERIGAHPSDARPVGPSRQVCRQLIPCTRGLRQATVAVLLGASVPAGTVPAGGLVAAGHPQAPDAQFGFVAPGTAERGASIRPQSGTPVNLMLIDHGTVVRQGLCALVEQQPDLVVVAQAASLRGAGTLDVTPDVIVTDIDLPDARHGDVISGLRLFFPPTPILVLTSVDRPATVQSVLAAGADGYLLKTSGAPDLFTGIRALAGGGTYLQPSVRVEVERWHLPRYPAVELTPKEEQVLRLLARGHTNAEVARLCDISRRTVETHRSRIHQKLGIRKRAELFQYAWDADLLEQDP